MTFGKRDIKNLGIKILAINRLTLGQNLAKFLRPSLAKSQGSKLALIWAKYQLIEPILAQTI